MTLHRNMVKPGWRLSHSLKSSGKGLPLEKSSCDCGVPAAETWEMRRGVAARVDVVVPSRGDGLRLTPIIVRTPAMGAG